MFSRFKKYIPFYKSNFLLAYPVVISQLGHMLTAVADSVMVGQLGIIPLAACALGNSIMSVFMVTGIGISQGVTPILSQENGRNNKKICGEYLEQGMIISLISSLLLFGIIFFISNYLNILDQPPLVQSATIDYLLVIGASLVPLMIFQSFRQFAEGLGYTKQAMYISIAGNALNILFNFILIYGWFGLPAMGLFGAGLGTLISRVFMAFGMGYFVLKSTLFHPYFTNFKLNAPDWIKIKNILRLGLPTAMQYFFEVGAFSGAAIMVGWIGATELAAHQIALNLAAFTYMGASGIGVSATIKAGNAFGKNDFEELKLSAISSYHLVLFYMSVTAVLFLTCNHILPWIYIDNQKVIDLAAQLLIVAAFFQLSDGVQVVGSGILRGLSDVKIPTIITLIAYWIVGLPLGYLLGFTFKLGVIGIWLSLSFALTVSGILLYIRFKNLIIKLNPEVFG